MNKRKKGKAIIATLVLFISLTSFNLHTFATSDTENKTYLIAYQKSLPSDYETTIEQAGGVILRTIPEIGGLEVQSSNPNFLEKLQSDSTISSINIENTYKLDNEETNNFDGNPIPLKTDADGTFWNSQWDIKRITNNGASYNVEPGGTLTNGVLTHKAVVGIIDTGIDYTHPDLKENFIGGKNFVPAGGFYGDDLSENGIINDVLDREGHGTHVAGSIAGNGKIKGVGPQLGIRAYRVFDSVGYTSNSSILEAIIAAANDKVDVINMSLGGFSFLNYTYYGTRYNDIADVLLWKRAIKYAVDHNVTVVTSSGNEGLNYTDKKSITGYLNFVYGDENLIIKGVTIETPGGLPGVINVSSSNKWSTDVLAFYSNYGNNFIDVAAPGGDNGPLYAATGDLNKRDFSYRALSTWPTYLDSYPTTIDPDHLGYAYLHGTSMASPKVAGIAGVIKAAHPEYKPSQVKALIENTALDYGKRGFDAFYGHGEANAFSALIEK